MDLAATIAEAKDAQIAQGSATGDEVHGKLGVAVRPLTAAERADNGGKNGLMVEVVTGAAARAGLQPGDVIRAVNGKAVASIGELRSAVRKSGHVALLIERGDGQIYVPIDVG